MLLIRNTATRMPEYIILIELLVPVFCLILFLGMVVNKRIAYFA